MNLENENRIPIAQGLDVPNFFKDVPNLFKDISRVPKSILIWGMTCNHFLRVSKRSNGP